MNSTVLHCLDDKDFFRNNAYHERIGLDTTNLARAILLVPTTVLILTLNTFGLLILRHVDNIQETTKIFHRSMLVADIGIGIFTAIPSTFAAITNRSRGPGGVLCGVQAFMTYVCGYGSYLSLLGLTVDRFLSVVCALRYPALMTVKRAQIFVCLMWVLSLLLVTEYGIVTNWCVWRSATFLTCVFALPSAKYFNNFQVILTLISATCLLVVVATYIKLYMISHWHARQIADANQNLDIPERRSSSSLRTVFIIVVSTFAFIVIPGIFLLLLYKIEHSKRAVLSIFMYFVPYFANKWINVVIYFLRSKEFRKVARRLVRSYYNSLKGFFCREAEAN